MEHILQWYPCHLFQAINSDLLMTIIAITQIPEGRNKNDDKNTYKKLKTQRKEALQVITEQ